MKKQRRSQGTMDSCEKFAQVFAEFLNTHFKQVDLNQAQPEQPDAFLVWGSRYTLLNFRLSGRISYAKLG